MTTEINQRFKILFVLGGIGILSVAAGHFTMLELCPLYGVVGLPCPSCGMTRAVLAALHGDFHAAFSFHPLFWACAFVPLIAVKKIPTAIIHVASLGLIVLFLVVWVVRLVLYFPSIEPMNFNEDALLPRIFSAVRRL